MLKSKNNDLKFKHGIEKATDFQAKTQMAMQWISFYFNYSKTASDFQHLYQVMALLLFPHESNSTVISIEVYEVILGLSGQHPSIVDGKFDFNYHHFIQLLENHFALDIPGFEQFRNERHQLTLQLKADLRPYEFEPKVLTSFVRNKLINQLYLPLFGDNLAKQLGSAGENRHTDRSGILLWCRLAGMEKQL